MARKVHGGAMRWAAVSLLLLSCCGCVSRQIRPALTRDDFAEEIRLACATPQTVEFDHVIWGEDSLFRSDEELIQELISRWEELKIESLLVAARQDFVMSSGFPRHTVVCIFFRAEEGMVCHLVTLGGWSSPGHIQRKSFSVISEDEYQEHVAQLRSLPLLGLADADAAKEESLVWLSVNYIERSYGTAVTRGRVSSSNYLGDGASSLASDFCYLLAEILQDSICTYSAFGDGKIVPPTEGDDCAFLIEPL